MSDAETRIFARAGRLPAGPDVWSARAGRVDRGIVVEISLRIDRGVVTEAAYLAFGDMDVLSCASCACERLLALSVSRAGGLAGLDLAAEAALPQEALGVALAVEDAIQAALRQYELGIGESSRGSDGYEHRSH